MRRFLLTMAAVATTLTGAACGDSTGLSSNIAGSYELQTINGQSLPVQLGDEIIEGAVFDIESNGEFVEVVQVREVGSPLSEQREFFGTWDRNGDEIIFEYDDGTTAFADRTSSSRFVLDLGGNDWAYRRF